MRAMVYAAPRELRLEELDDPQLGERDILVRIDACGICGSDVSSYEHGHYAEPGQVLGHEMTSTVEQLGCGLTGVQPGDRVALLTARSCGACPYCLDGRPFLCGESRRLSIGYGARGGFADLMVVRDVEVGVDVLPVPPDVAGDDMVWTEPLSVAMHAVRRAGLSPDSGPVLVVGGGSVGLCVVAAARAEGVTDITVVEPRAASRAAAVRLGARALEPADLKAEQTPFISAIDTSGVPTGITAALGKVRPGGRLILVGLNDGPVPWPTPAVELITSFAFDRTDFIDAVAHIVSGRVRLGSFITHRFSLSETGAAISASAHDSDVIKAVVYPGRG